MTFILHGILFLICLFLYSEIRKLNKKLSDVDDQLRIINNNFNMQAKHNRSINFRLEHILTIIKKNDLATIKDWIVKTFKNR